MKTSLRFATLAATLVVLLSAPPARADELIWNVPSGDFSTPSNWNDLGWSYFSENILNNGGTATINSNALCGDVYVYGGSTIAQLNGSVSVTDLSLAWGLVAGSGLTRSAAPAG